MKLPCAVVLKLAFCRNRLTLPVALYLTVLVVQTQLFVQQSREAASVTFRDPGPAVAVRCGSLACLPRNEGRDGKERQCSVRARENVRSFG